MGPTLNKWGVLVNWGGRVTVFSMFLQSSLERIGLWKHGI